MSTSHWPHWLPLTTVVVLGAAATLAGVTAWKSTVMSGHAVQNFTLSTKAVNDANALAHDSERNITSERQLFIDYQYALSAPDKNRAASIFGMMNPNTRNAIKWWNAQPAGDRPLSPFVSANPDWSAPSIVIGAQASLDRADEYLHQAKSDLSQANNLKFLSAMLTIVLLASGLTWTFESRKARVTLLTASIVVFVMCLIGTWWFW